MFHLLGFLHLRFNDNIADYPHLKGKSISTSYNIDLMHNSEQMETGVDIDEVKSYFNDDSAFNSFKIKLDKLEKGQMIGYFGYAYGKNIVRVKDGWDIHLQNDINKFSVGYMSGKFFIFHCVRFSISRMVL